MTAQVYDLASARQLRDDLARARGGEQLCEVAPGAFVARGLRFTVTVNNACYGDVHPDQLSFLNGTATVNANGD